MAGLIDDLRAETAELEKLLVPLDAAGWDQPTPALPWSVRDQVSHLAFFDTAATTAAVDPDRFREERVAAFSGIDNFTESIAEEHRSTPGPQVLAWFREARAALIAAYSIIDPKTRVPWYGPDMSAPSALTARIMETWAHGQDIADGLGAVRLPTAALRQVAHIGVRTFANSFVSNGLDVPEIAVTVALTAPDGSTWTWGSDVDNMVRGTAIDFCLVVTQRRHLDDCALEVVGPVASQWMSIAQAFAGPAGAGRAPGQFA